MLKKIKPYLFPVALVLVILHPVIELDYLIATYLPIRFTTLINFIILPLLILLCFLSYEKDKKRLFILALLYGLPFIIYFFLHCKTSNYLSYNLFLPDNYVFLIKDEIVYTITLLLPLVYIYFFYQDEIKEEWLEIATITSSLTVALPIFLSNLFICSYSTYEGYTKDNILSWFSLPFSENNRPRKYASKFFFKEGNTIGILLVCILPLLYYFFSKAKGKKKAFIGSLIAIHSLAMIILSTRVATYSTILIPLALFFIHLILTLLKQDKLQKSFLAFTLIMMIFNGLIIPFSPAYQNQKIDAMDYGYVIEHDQERNDIKQEVKRGGDGLIPYSKEWHDYWTYIFEDYSFMIGVTPPIYYTKWYDYHHDPKFWADLIFDYELSERVNGRQIENIFTKYKWDNLNNTQKLSGLGYGTFMRGGILIEQDFKMQYYAYGLVGFIFLMGPWLVTYIYAALKLITGYSKGKWTFLSIILMMSITLAFASAYLSGHCLDELSVSLFISLCFAILLRRLNYEQA